MANKKHKRRKKYRNWTKTWELTFSFRFWELYRSYKLQHLFLREILHFYICSWVWESQKEAIQTFYSTPGFLFPSSLRQLPQEMREMGAVVHSGPGYSAVSVRPGGGGGNLGRSRTHTIWSNCDDRKHEFWAPKWWFSKGNPQNFREIWVGEISYFGQIPSVRLVYLPSTWMADLYGFHVGKYSSPMDGMVDDPEESKKKYLDVPGN